jgi:transposase
MARAREDAVLYVGLDVSSKRTAVCAVDAAGKVVRTTTVDSTPEAVSGAVRSLGLPVERIGLEAGPTSAWLARALREAGLPAIVIDAAHAASALRTGFRNKTDKNDARGIAEMMRVNTFRAVHVKSPEAQRTRGLLVVRAQLRRQSLEARNAAWAILQSEGLRPPRITGSEFQRLVTEAMGDPALAPMLRPLTAVAERLDELLAEVDRAIAAQAKASPVCRRLMTVPGVGPLVAVTYVAGVDDPSRFDRARTVGAHFGLTPRRHQSGEVDWSGGISRAGDASVRRALYQAANALIHFSGHWCALKSWAVRLAARRGLGKAKVALARKLAVALWRYVTQGVVPEGAVLKGA